MVPIPHPRPVRAGGAALAALLVTLVVAGCRVFTTPARDTVSAEVTSNVATSVRLITSTSFTVERDEHGIEFFTLFTGDTAWVRTPFSADHDIRHSGRFYARVAESEDPGAVITLRIRLDGRQTWSRTDSIRGSGIQYYLVIR